jgi:hypothetical protein
MAAAWAASNRPKFQRRWEGGPEMGKWALFGWWMDGPSRSCIPLGWATKFGKAFGSAVLSAGFAEFLALW